MAAYDSLVASLEELTLAQMIRLAARAGDDVEKSTSGEPAKRVDVERIDRLLYFLWYGQAPARSTPADLMQFHSLEARLRTREDWPFERPHHGGGRH
jgi:hypothetical protein